MKFILFLCLYIILEIESLLNYPSSSENISRLIPNNEIPFLISTPQIYKFFVVLDEYEINEENTITAQFNDNSHNTNIIKSAYANTVDLFISPDDSLTSIQQALDPFFPKNEISNIFPFVSWNKSSTYHLYFTQNTEKDPNKHRYLLFYIEIDNLSMTFDGSFVLSPRIKKLEFKPFIRETIQLKDNIPQYYKLSLPEIDNNNNTLVYFHSPNIATTFFGNLIKKQSEITYEMNNNHRNEQIIAFTMKDLRRYNNIVIRFYGKAQTIIMIIETTEGVIYNYNDDSFTKNIINHQDMKCDRPYYYINDHKTQHNSFLYYETLFGLFKIYHLYDSSYLFIDEIKTLLPSIENDNPRMIIRLNQKREIIGIECKSPGKMNLNFFPKQEENIELKLNKKIFIYIKNNLKIQVPKQSTVTYFELSTPFNNEVTIDNTVTITKNNSYNETLKSESSKSFILFSKNDTYVIASFIEPNKFRIKESTGVFYNTDQYIAFKINKPVNNEGKYKEINIILREVQINFYYNFGYGNLNHIPITDNQWSYVEIKQEDYNKHHFTDITFPYDKYNYLQKDNEFYYLAINFNTPSDKAITIEVQKKDYETYTSIIDINSITKLTQDNNIAGLKRQDIPDDTSKLFVFISLCTSMKLSYQHRYNEIAMSNTFPLIKKNTFLYLRNMFIETNLEFKYISEDDELANFNNNIDTLMMSYDYSDKSLSYEFYLELDNIDYQLKFDGHTLSWLNPGQSRYFKEYQVYLFSNHNETIKKDLLDNLCYLHSLLFYKTINQITFDLLEPGEYWVNIVGVVKGSLKADIPFKPIMITVHKNNLFWLWIILGIFVVLSIGNILYFQFNKKNNQFLIPEDDQPIIADEDMISSNH